MKGNLLTSKFSSKVANIPFNNESVSPMRPFYKAT